MKQINCDEFAVTGNDIFPDIVICFICVNIIQNNDCFVVLGYFLNLLIIGLDTGIYDLEVGKSFINVVN